MVFVIFKLGITTYYRLRGNNAIATTPAITIILLMKYHRRKMEYFTKNRFSYAISNTGRLTFYTISCCT